MTNESGARPVSPSPEPRTCRLSILWTFVTGSCFLVPEVENDELVGGDSRVGQEVRARIDRGRVDPEVPQDGRRRDVDARSPREVLGVLLPREPDGDERPLTLEGDDRWLAGLHDLPEWDHRRLAEACRELADARGAAGALGGALDRKRDELRVSRRARVHANLAIGQVGQLGSHLLASFVSSAAAVTTTAAAMPRASVMAASAAPERAW